MIDWAAIIIVALPASAMVIASILTRRPGLFLVSATLIFAQALPLIGLALADDAALLADLPHYLWEVHWICILCTIAFAFGYAIPALRIKPDPDLRANATDHRTAEWANAIAAAIAVALAMSLPGGIWGLAVAGFERVPVDDLRFSLAYTAACVLNFTVIALAISRLGKGRRPPFVSVALVIMLFWILGGRAQLFVVLTSIALCYLAYGKLTVRTALFGAIGFAVLAALTLHFRLILQGGDGSIFDSFGAGLAQISLLDGYAIAARYLDTFGPQIGLYLDSAQQIIPRALNPDKPDQLGRLLRLMVRDDDLGGLTVGAHGEFFVVGSYIGVAVLGTLFGAIVAILDNVWRGLGNLSSTAQTAILILIPLFAVFALRAGFDNAVFRLYILLFCVGVSTCLKALVPVPIAKVLPPGPRLIR